MKHEELKAASANLAGDFRSIEPHLRDLDKHLTLRSYLEGYALGDVEKEIWLVLRGNKAAIGFIRKNGLPNLTRWFTFIEQSHPEVQEAVKADKAAKAPVANKGGANYNLALQDTEKGVVTRFLPEPSYDALLSSDFSQLLIFSAEVTFTLDTPRQLYLATTLAMWLTKGKCVYGLTIPTRQRRARSSRTQLSRILRSWELSPIP